MHELSIVEDAAGVVTGVLAQGLRWVMRSLMPVRYKESQSKSLAVPLGGPGLI